MDQPRHAVPASLRKPFAAADSGDTAAAEAVDRIRYDFKRIHRMSLPASNQYLVALRAVQFDDWCAELLGRHPDAVVLHLGCGLDGRAFRVSVPPSVSWFDVDQPSVIGLRRRLYDDTENYRMIGSSVTELQWLDEVPAGRPTLMVAEGLLMYLREDEVRLLLQRLIDRFPGGEMHFDTLSALARCSQGLHPRNHHLGHPRRAPDRRLESPAALPRAVARPGRLPADPVGRRAVDLPADVADRRARLRRAEPLRILSCHRADVSRRRISAAGSAVA